MGYLPFHIYVFAYIISAVSPETLFKLLSDSTRLRMTALLAAEGELCVCEFTQVLGESQPKVSRHLALMREEGLVDARREGTWMHYRLNPGLPAWAGRIIASAHAELRRQAPFRQDAGQLKRMGERPGSKGCA
jgi:ArsR family transcriptional regulator